MRKFMFGLVSAIAWFSILASHAHAKCGSVEIAEMNWVSARVVTAVAKFLMEKGYDCSVKIVPTTTTAVLKTLKETNKPDVITELWVNSAPGYGDLVEKGKLRTLSNVFSDGGVEGWWIPKYLADNHPELRTIEGILARPELVGGRFYSCPEGWGCRVINDNLVKAYDFDSKRIQAVYPKSDDELAKSIAQAFANKTPWFGYYWAPTPVIGKYPMVKVDAGAFVEAVHACNKKKGCTQPGKSAYPGSRVITAVTEAFATKAPEIVTLMQRVSFTNNQMGRVLAWQAEGKASADEAVVFFLRNYGPVWQGWVTESAREKITGALRPSQ